MQTAFLDHLRSTLTEIEGAGLYKRERQITGPQGGRIAVGDRTMVNLCANNYLGLADHPDIVHAASDAAPCARAE